MHGLARPLGGVAHRGAGGPPGALAVDPDRAGIEQRGQLAAARLGKEPGERLVDPVGHFHRELHTASIKIAGASAPGASSVTSALTTTSALQPIRDDSIAEPCLACGVAISRSPARATRARR